MHLVDIEENVLLNLPQPIELLRVIQYRGKVRRRHLVDCVGRSRTFSKLSRPKQKLVLRRGFPNVGEGLGIYSSQENNNQVRIWELFSRLSQEQVKIYFGKL